MISKHFASASKSSSKLHATNVRSFNIPKFAQSTIPAQKQSFTFAPKTREFSTTQWTNVGMWKMQSFQKGWVKFYCSTASSGKFVIFAIEVYRSSGRLYWRLVVD